MIGPKIGRLVNAGSLLNSLCTKLHGCSFPNSARHGRAGEPEHLLQVMHRTLGKLLDINFRDTSTKKF
jgi:hypothetical protein